MSNNINLVHWPLVGGLLHLVQRWGDWAPPRPLLAVPSVTKQDCKSNPCHEMWNYLVSKSKG